MIGKSASATRGLKLFICLSWAAVYDQVTSVGPLSALPKFVFNDFCGNHASGKNGGKAGCSQFAALLLPSKIKY